MLSECPYYDLTDQDPSDLEAELQPLSEDAYTEFGRLDLLEATKEIGQELGKRSQEFGRRRQERLRQVGQGSVDAVRTAAERVRLRLVRDGDSQDHDAAAEADDSDTPDEWVAVADATEVLRFGESSAVLISAVSDGSMTVNWTCRLGPDQFLEASEALVRLMGPERVGLLIERGSGEPEYTEPVPAAHFRQSVPDLGGQEDVHLIRVDLSDTASTAWQRTDPQTTFAGIGEDSSRISWQDVERFMRSTADDDVNQDTAFVAIADAFDRAKQAFGGSAAAGDPAGTPLGV